MAVKHPDELRRGIESALSHGDRHAGYRYAQMWLEYYNEPQDAKDRLLLALALLPITKLRQEQLLAYKLWDDGIKLCKAQSDVRTPLRFGIRIAEAYIKEKRRARAEETIRFVEQNCPMEMLDDLDRIKGLFTDAFGENTAKILPFRRR